MYTQCPQCDTVFRISATDLGVAHGEVRCGQCNTTFNALVSLSEAPPPGAPQPNFSNAERGVESAVPAELIDAAVESGLHDSEHEETTAFIPAGDAEGSAAADVADPPPDFWSATTDDAQGVVLSTTATEHFATDEEDGEQDQNEHPPDDVSGAATDEAEHPFGQPADAEGTDSETGHASSESFASETNADEQEQGSGNAAARNDESEYEEDAGDDAHSDGDDTGENTDDEDRSDNDGETRSDDDEEDADDTPADDAGSDDDDNGEESGDEDRRDNDGETRSDDDEEDADDTPADDAGSDHDSGEESDDKDRSDNDETRSDGDEEDNEDAQSDDGATGEETDVDEDADHALAAQTGAPEQSVAESDELSAIDPAGEPDGGPAGDITADAAAAATDTDRDSEDLPPADTPAAGLAAAKADSDADANAETSEIGEEADQDPQRVAQDMRADVADLQRYLEPPRRLWVSVLWGALSLVATVTLIAQFAHHWRHELIHHEALGPLLQQVYDRLGFSLQPDWDVEGYRLVARPDVASVEGEEGQPARLRITAALENQAERAQPLPLVRVTLEDRWGSAIATRNFLATEYSRQPSNDAMLAPGERMRIDLRVVDPGGASVGYTIDLCLPTPGEGIRCAGDGGG